jgi:hypothetical protein
VLQQETPKAVSTAFYDRTPRRQAAGSFVRSMNSDSGGAAAAAVGVLQVCVGV